jgi:ATP-dependent RNA helicase DeaD
MRRFIPLGRSLTEAEEESPLIAMLLDEYYQRTLQAAPQSPSGEPAEEEPVALMVEPAHAGRPLPGGEKKRPRRRSGRDRGRERTRHPEGNRGQI